MENRHIFALDGITGMLIAVVLLLSIVVTFTIMGIGIQQANAENFYELQDEKQIKMFDAGNAAHRVNVN